MNFLSAEQVLFIHARIISETGGSHGLRDLGLLEAAIARPKATFEGRDLYPDIFSKTAALAHSLVKNHPFVDGNKRTGIAAAGLFLRVNGFKLSVSQDELESIAVQIALGDVSIDTLAHWLESNSTE